jgi:drug/metabolite transporter (DMT)-like permease
MPTAELAALGTAIAIATSHIVATSATRHFGAFAFNRWRLLAALAILLPASLLRGGWDTVTPAGAGVLALSGMIGIVLGDTAVYGCVARLGPRRAGLLYAMNAPLTAILGFALLGENLAAVKILGIAMVAAGVTLAIAYPTKEGGGWDYVEGSYALGIGLGLVGALGHASAVLIARPVMAAGTDPATAAGLRIAVALLGLAALTALPFRVFRSAGAWSPRQFGRAVLSGWLGTGIGMTLMLLALSEGPAGIVATLASTTPIFLLPMLWAITRSPPAFAAWAGAALAVAGTALIVIPQIA